MSWLRSVIFSLTGLVTGWAAMQLGVALALYHFYTSGELAIAFKHFWESQFWDHPPDWAGIFFISAMTIIFSLSLLPTAFEKSSSRKDHIVGQLFMLILMASTVFQLLIFFATRCMVDGISDGKNTITSSGTCLYFSIVTWTTLGYGDYRPTEALQMWAAVEAMVGYIFMAIFIAVLVKAISYRENDPPIEYDISFTELSERLQRRTKSQRH